jgi:hypothetical protein
LTRFNLCCAIGPELKATGVISKLTLEAPPSDQKFEIL